MKLVTVISVFFLGFANVCCAQGYRSEFEKYFQEGDTLKQREVLSKWQLSDPEDPELFTCEFNYYYFRSMQEVITVTAKEPEGEKFVLTDSAGRVAGFLGSQITYNKALFQKGLERIDAGIKLYPDRLDMRFGKIYVLGEIKDWERFTDEIIQAVRYSKENDNQWTWLNDRKVTDGKKFFLSALQDYQLDLYNSGNDSLLFNMRKIAAEILKVYPGHIESLSNISITYLVTGEHDKAIETLLQAEKINPEDVIILNNIAHGYNLKGEREKSITYYEKVIKYAKDETTREYARSQIEALKN